MTMPKGYNEKDRKFTRKEKLICNFCGQTKSNLQLKQVTISSCNFPAIYKKPESKKQAANEQAHTRGDKAKSISIRMPLMNR